MFETVTDELARLGIGAPLPPTKVKLRGQWVELSPDESIEIGIVEARDFYRGMLRIVRRRNWQSQTTSQKIATIKNVCKRVSDQRASRVMLMREQKVTVTEGIDKRWAAAQPLDSLLDIYPLVSPEAKEILEPFIYTKIIAFRKTAPRKQDKQSTATTQRKIAEYTHAIRSAAT
jgi:hypothetical protein